MFPEISLNILDVAQNSVKAKASLIEINITADLISDRLYIGITDNGCGMSSDVLAKVTDPFFTSRTTRKVGLGVSFFKLAAELTGGSFNISSKVGEGTNVFAQFVLSSIDRMPLGDIAASIHTLIVYAESSDFVYTYTIKTENDKQSFTLDTRELKEILGDVPFTEPDVSNYILDYLKENTECVNKILTINL